jgi:hypothetical protein
MIFRRRRTRIEIAHTAVRLAGNGAWADGPDPADPSRPSPPPAPLRSRISPAAAAATTLREKPSGTEAGEGLFATTLHVPADKEKR